MPNPLARKMVFFIVYSGVYFNLLLIVFVPQVYCSPIYLTYLLMYYAAGLVDTVVRPLPEKTEVDKHTTRLLGFFLIWPVLLTFAYNENLLIVATLVPAWDSPNVSYAGLLLYLVGAAIAVVSRTHLGRQGTGNLMIREEHELITTGLYHRIRHPMYLGGLLGVVAFGLVFRSIIVMTITVVLYLFVFRQRWIKEEQLLEAEFGEEYIEYKRRTKRIIPFVY